MFRSANAPLLRLLCLLVTTCLVGVLALLPPDNTLASFLYGCSLFFGLVLPLRLDRIGPFMPELRSYLGETIWRAILLASLLFIPTVPWDIVIATVSFICCTLVACNEVEHYANKYSARYYHVLSIFNGAMYIIIVLVAGFIANAHISVLLEYPGTTLVLTLLECALLIQMLILRYMSWTAFDGNRPMCTGQSSIVWKNLSKEESPDAFWKHFHDYTLNYPKLMDELTPYALRALPFDLLLSYFDSASWSNRNASIPAYTEKYIIEAINARDKNVSFLWALHCPNHRDAIFDIRALRADKTPIISDTFALPE